MVFHGNSESSPQNKTKQKYQGKCIYRKKEEKRKAIPRLVSEPRVSNFHLPFTIFHLLFSIYHLLFSTFQFMKKFALFINVRFDREETWLGRTFPARQPVSLHANSVQFGVVHKPIEHPHPPTICLPDCQGRCRWSECNLVAHQKSQNQPNFNSIDSKTTSETFPVDRNLNISIFVIFAVEFSSFPHPTLHSPTDPSCPMSFNTPSKQIIIIIIRRSERE